MYGGCTVAVVVPAYDEAGFVGDVIRSVPPWVDRIYAVDDASTDGTWTEIRAAARAVDRRDGSDDADGRSPNADAGEATADAPPAAGGRPPATDGSGPTRASDDGAVDGPGEGIDGPRVVPIRHEENRGVGGAIKTGYRRAVEDGVDVTAVLAGDGQMDPAQLDRLLDPVVEGRAGYAKGNRLVRAAWRAEMPRFRLVGNAVLAVLTKIASGYWRVGDPQNGYTAVSRDALEAAEFERMYEFYGYCNELLVRLAAADVRVADVPIPPAYGDEESHIELRSYVPRVSAMLLRAFAWRLATGLRRDRNPAAVLYPLGVLAGLQGVRALGRRVRGRAAGTDDSGGGRPARAFLASALLVVAAAATEWASNRDRAFREGD